MHLLKYVKAAFLNRWNLLAFAGSLGFAALSGVPDILIPLVLAGEIAYLGFLGTHPRFRKYVEVEEAEAARASTSATAEQGLQQILQALPVKLLKRFEALRSRCLELREIAANLKNPDGSGAPLPLEEMQLAGLDRLLWIYLRLLYTQYMLDRFFQRTSEDQIQNDIRDLLRRLELQAKAPDTPQRQKVRKTIEDNLETSRARLANLQKAREQGELVQAEIERLENKIMSLSELAVNRNEPGYISSQVDQVAGSMVQTERTMNELEFATGLAVDEAVPQMVQRSVIRTRN